MVNSRIVSAIDEMMVQMDSNYAASSEVREASLRLATIRDDAVDRKDSRPQRG